MNFIDLKAQYKKIETVVDARIKKVLDHGQYIMGPEVFELEERLASYVGVKHCIGVASGTDALLVAMMALGIKAGDEIITTPFTFIATGETVALLGAKPVFVDIDPATYNIDPELIEAAITNKTKAIMPVALYGQCADMDKINEIANRHGLPVIEDGAQSFGSTYKGKMSCNLSTIGCTSFFPSKPLGGYGDGGACFTSDDELAKIMKEIRVHGQDRRYHHPRIGINGRLDTIQAAILLAKMEIFPSEVEERGKIGAKYSELLQGIGAKQSGEVESGILTPYIAAENTSVYAQYTIQVDNRESVQQVLKDHEIPTAVHYPVPLNEQPAMREICNKSSTPISAYLSKRVISLPMHPLLTFSEQKQIVDILSSIVQE